MMENWSIVASLNGDPSCKRYLLDMLRSEGFTVRDVSEWKRIGVKYYEDNSPNRVTPFQANHCLVWKDNDFEARAARCKAQWESDGWQDTYAFKDYRELPYCDKIAVRELLAKGKPAGGGTRPGSDNTRPHAEDPAREAKAMWEVMGRTHLDDTLRPYQTEAKRKIAEAWLSHRSVMYQMPTGTGKTRLFVSLIADIRKHNAQSRILIVTHREELVQQISASLSQHYGLAHGILQGKNTRNLEQPIVVAAVQSIGNEESSFSHIIVDEAHHCLAPSYKALWKRFPTARKLGVTATPYRLKRATFGELFDCLITSAPMKDFIAQGYLADYRFYTISSRRTSLQRINRITKFGADGDYQKKDLDAIYNNKEEVEFAYRCYARYAAGKQGIVYAVNRRHAELTAACFRENGVAAANIDGTTRAEERAALTARFRQGNLQVLVNVELFTEGFDCPGIEFVLLARPTRSLGLYLQQVGRALRPFKMENGKAIILDCAGLHARFGLPDRKRDWHLHFAGEKPKRENYTKPLGSDTWLRLDTMQEVGRTVFHTVQPMEKGWQIATDENQLKYIVDHSLGLLTPLPAESVERESSGNYIATFVDKGKYTTDRLCDLRFTPDLRLVAEGEVEIGGCKLYVIKERTRRLYAVSLSLGTTLYKAPRPWGRWLKPDRRSLTSSDIYPRLIEADRLPDEMAVENPDNYLMDNHMLYASDGTTYRRVPNGYQLYYRQTEQEAALYDGTLHELWRGKRIIALEDHALLFASEGEPPHLFHYYAYLFEGRLLPPIGH